MTIERQDAEAALQKVALDAQQHTELVISSRPCSSGRLLLGALASGVLLRTSEGCLLVTCEHVTRKGTVHHFGAGRLNRPQAPTNPNEHAVRAAEFIAANRKIDLAILRSAPSDGSPSLRTPYDIFRSEFVNEQFLSNHTGTAAFIFGYWGEMTSIAHYDDGQLYVEACIYSACGPLVQIQPNEIIADMAETDILFRGTDNFPKLRGLKATGGRRDLKGISGSGLWMLADDGVFLVGIVLGPRRGRSDEHLIRVIPIWLLREWMMVLSKTGKFAGVSHPEDGS